MLQLAFRSELQHYLHTWSAVPEQNQTCHVHVLKIGGMYIPLYLYTDCKLGMVDTAENHSVESNYQHFIRVIT